MSSSYSEEYFFELLSRAIDTCQEIHNDSRTPLESAELLAPIIRELVAYKREIRKKEFNVAATNLEYKAATGSLKAIVTAVKADIIEHDKTMDFINDAAKSLAAVIKLAALFV